MKNAVISVALCLVFIILSGCATSNYATRKSKFVPDQYQPIALLRTDDDRIVVSGIGPLPNETSSFFYFSDYCNAQFLKAFPDVYDSTSAARFIQEYEAGILYGHSANIVPDHFVVVVQLSTSDFKGGSFTVGGHAEQIGYRHLNAIWTVPVDIVTSPVQALVLAIMLASGFDG